MATRYGIKPSTYRRYITQELHKHTPGCSLAKFTLFPLHATFLLTVPGVGKKQLKVEMQLPPPHLPSAKARRMLRRFSKELASSLSAQLAAGLRPAVETPV